MELFSRANCHSCIDFTPRQLVAKVATRPINLRLKSPSKTLHPLESRGVILQLSVAKTSVRYSQFVMFLSRAPHKDEWS